MEKNQLFALAINILLLVFIIYSIKRNRLKEKYAILWILSALILILFSVWFEPIEYFSKMLEIKDPLNLLYLLGGLCIILIMLHFSFSLSKLHNNYKILTQNIALLEEKYNKELSRKHKGNVRKPLNKK